MLSFHCNCLDYVTCPCYFVCLFVFFRSKGFICIVSKYWKQVYFRFRSIRARRPFGRRSELMSNQYADVRFVVSLGSSRNSTSHKERWEVCSALYHFKRTCWSDYVSCIDLDLLSFYLETLPMRWTTLENHSSWFDKVARIHKKRCKCVTNHWKRCNAF